MVSVIIFDRTMFKICKGIRAEQLKTFGDEFNSFHMSAFDIACGYYFYLFSIARWQLQVGVKIYKCHTVNSVVSASINTGLAHNETLVFWNEQVHNDNFTGVIIV